VQDAEDVRRRVGVLVEELLHSLLDGLGPGLLGAVGGNGPHTPVDGHGVALAEQPGPRFAEDPVGDHVPQLVGPDAGRLPVRVSKRGVWRRQVHVIEAQALGNGAPAPGGLPHVPLPLTIDPHEEPRKSGAIATMVRPFAAPGRLSPAGCGRAARGREPSTAGDGPPRPLTGSPRGGCRLRRSRGHNSRRTAAEPEAQAATAAGERPSSTRSQPGDASSSIRIARRPARTRGACRA